jgi:hypothetical protein
LPQTTRCFVTPQVKRFEFDIANNEFVRIGMQRRNVNLHAVLLEHMEESCFTSIVQTKKENFGVFVVETCEAGDMRNENAR